MRVALYCRVSTEEQAAHGVSVEAQQAALRAWAQKERMQIVGEYVDAGFSARKPANKRPELMRLLNDVKAGKIDLIAFTKLDRWFRNISEYYKVQEVLETHNTNWRAIHEDYETMTAAGRLKVNIMLAVNQDEADRDSERIVAVFNRKKELGEVISGSVPLGYKIENKKYAIDEDSAHMARDMFDRLLATRSAYAVQRYMLRTYDYKRDITTLKRLLKNPMYKGEKYGQKGYCPALITPGVFDAAQDILKSRAMRSSPVGRVYLFRGLLSCVDCGHAMTGIVSKDIYYYRCSQRVSVGDCDNSNYIREERIEEYLTSHILHECAAHNVTIEKRRKAQPKTDEAQLRRKMLKLKDLYLNDLIEKADYERDYLAIKAELEAVEKIKSAAPTPIDIDELRDTLTTYHAMNREQKQAFWALTVREIQVEKGRVVSFTLSHI